MSTLEITYNYFLQSLFGIASPFKRTLIQAKCEVHKFINLQALKIVDNDGYTAAHKLLSTFILDLNKGAVWADQDFKSSNHFYNPYKNKGLYGRKNAKDLASKYYKKALCFWEKGDASTSFFYLGAALHILQDMTIPQHASIRLLDNHRQYETFIKQSYLSINDFDIEKGSCLLSSIEEYIRLNSRIALKIYNRFRHISNDEKRYYKFAKCTFPLARRTTAGAMIMFYKDISSQKSTTF